MAKKADPLLEACKAFAAAANVIDALPTRIDDTRPLRDVLPGAWPTVGDLRLIRDHLVASGFGGERS